MSTRTLSRALLALFLLVAAERGYRWTERRNAPAAPSDTLVRGAMAAHTPSRLQAAAPGSEVDPGLEGIRRALDEAGTHVYLPAMFAETDSVIRRWPAERLNELRVTFLTGEVPGAAPAHLAIARSAFRVWEGIIPLHFQEVLDTTGADLIVKWRPNFDFDRSGQADLEWDQRGRIRRAVIQLALTDREGNTLPEEGLRAVALHEVGHALGLPHSDDPDDLMYPTTRRPVLTPRDSATIRLLYQLPPTSIKWTAPSSSP